eukprot:GHVR01048766.1.p1 GENE.GHVR01048766.1~~GHVR01048766.1.p1  ORF type:complete len:152 (+),score=41.27 GHVR01048766.1:9-464(+)
MWEDDVHKLERDRRDAHVRYQCETLLKDIKIFLSPQTRSDVSRAVSLSLSDALVHIKILEEDNNKLKELLRVAQHPPLLLEKDKRISQLLDDLENIKINHTNELNRQMSKLEIEKRRYTHTHTHMHIHEVHTRNCKVAHTHPHNHTSICDT